MQEVSAKAVCLRAVFKKVDVRGVQGNFFQGLKKQAMQIPAGEGIEIIQSFEPIPLYEVMDGLGFEHHTVQTGDAEFHAYFYRKEVRQEDKDIPMRPAALTNMPLIDAEVGKIAVQFWNLTWNDEHRYLPCEMRLLLSLANAVGAGRMRSQQSDEVCHKMAGGETAGVQVNVTKTKVCRPDDAKYLGFSFYKRNDKWRPKPHLKSVQKFKEKLHGYSKRSWSVSMDYRISKLNPVIRGWINYFRICDMKTLMKEMDRWLRVRVRMCIWKQWKTPQNREKALVKLGFPRWGAHRYANTRKGCMAVAKSRIMTRAIPKRILDLKGLLSLADHCQSVHSF